MTDVGLAHWRSYGERGISSEAIANQLAGAGGASQYDHPYDPSDFRRCELLLRQVPDLRERLPEMADVGAVWAALVERWDEIVETMEAEVPGCFTRPRPRGAAPKAYALIQECLRARTQACDSSTRH